MSEISLMPEKLSMVDDDEITILDSEDPSPSTKNKRVKRSGMGLEPAFSKNDAFNKTFGTGNDDVARGDAPGQVQGNLDTHEADVANPHNTTFLKLGDTSSSYAGQAGNIPVVNSTPDGLEFEARNNAFNKSFGSITGSVCEGDDPRLSDKRQPVSDAVLDGYVETPGTGLPTTGTITVPLDGRIYEVTLTGDATIDIGAVPAAGNVGSAILFLTPAGNNVSYAAGLFWAGGAAVVAGAYMRYTVSNAPGGNKVIDAEELATV